MGLFNSIKKFKFSLKKKERSRELLNEEEESCDSLSHDQEAIDDGELENILDADELLCSSDSSLCSSDSSSIREIDEDGKSRESDEESEDILDADELCNGKSKENDEEEDVLDLGDLSPLHEISTEEKNNALHLKKREIIFIEEEEVDVLDLDEISHSSSLHEITEDEEEKKSRELNEDGSSGEGRAQKCLRCSVQVKKEEIARNIKEEKNKALHVKNRENSPIEEDVLDLGEICDSSSHHERIFEDEEREKSRQMNEEEIAAAGNEALHVKKREIIFIDEEEVEARKEEKIREMIASEKQEKERAILEFDRALEYAKRKLKPMTEKPRRDECVSYEGVGPSCVLQPQNTSILQEEKPKKSKKRVTFIVEEKEKAEGICISNEKEEKIERFDGQWRENPTRSECVSYKGARAGPNCVFGPQDSSILQEEKPKKYEKRVRFTVEEKGKAEAIHVSNEEEKIEIFAGQEEHKMKKISSEEDEKLEAFVNKTTKKGHHHNDVCNEEEKIKERLDETIPQKKSVSSEEEKMKINEDFAKRNPKKEVSFDEGRKIEGFDERQAKKGPVSDCSFQWKELMERKGNFDDGDVAEFNGGEQWGNSCGCHYCDEENVVHHNKNLQFRYLFSFGIGLVMFLRVYYGISRYLMEI